MMAGLEVVAYNVARIDDGVRPDHGVLADLSREVAGIVPSRRFPDYYVVANHSIFANLYVLVSYAGGQGLTYREGAIKVAEV